MSTQDLVTQWLAEAATLRQSADQHRKNGMFELARGERLKADQLTDCATRLQALLPPFTEATEESPAGASDASASHATHVSGAAPLFSDRVKGALHLRPMPGCPPKPAHSGSEGEATVPPLDAGLPQSSGSLPDLETMRQQLAQSLEEFGYQASGSCSATAPSKAAPTSPGLPTIETTSCPDSAGEESPAQPQTDYAATA